MFLKNLTVKRLIASWGVYWALLLGVVAWRPLLEYIRLQRTDGHGQVSLSYSGSFLTLALWIAGPPLLLFVVWLLSRTRAGDPVQERESDKV